MKSCIPGFRRRDFLKVTGAAAVLAGMPFAARIGLASEGEKLKIGIIGSGHVGSALAGVWAKAGNEVMLSSRHLDNDQKLAASMGGNAQAGTPQQAAAFGPVLLFAVPYSAFPDLVKTLGSSLKGRWSSTPATPSHSATVRLPIRRARRGQDSSTRSCFLARTSCVHSTPWARHAWPVHTRIRGR